MTNDTIFLACMIFVTNFFCLLIIKMIEEELAKKFNLIKHQNDLINNKLERITDTIIDTWAASNATLKEIQCFKRHLPKDKE